MVTMMRRIGAVVAGFIAASVVMMIVESINGHVLFPDLAKKAQGVTDREQVRQIIAEAPVVALLVVIGGWSLGSVIGGVVTGLLAGRGSVRPAITLGILLTLAGLANNLMIPPPLWFWFASMPVLGAGVWLGTRLVTPRTPSPD